MRLAQFSMVVGATPRWIQNAMAVIGLRPRYTIEGGRRLALSRVLRETCGMPLRDAYRTAGSALEAWPGLKHWRCSSPDGSVVLTIDLQRFLSTFTARLALARSSLVGDRRGRPRAMKGRGIALAREHGIDIGLLEASLNRTPDERLRALDEHVAFVRSFRAGRA